MASMEVGYNCVVQELQENLKQKSFYPHMEQRQRGNYEEQNNTDRLMEDVQFDGALLRNGILLKATEFELAKQFDDTLADNKGSVNQIELQNPGENKEQKFSLFENHGERLPLYVNCLVRTGCIVSVNSSVEEVNTKDSGVSDLTVAATRRLSDLVIHTDEDFEIMSIEEQDLLRPIRTSTPVEGPRLGLGERESGQTRAKKSKRSQAPKRTQGPKIRAVLAKGRKKVGDGIIHGIASLMAAIL